jgi:hypothetical protein
MKLTDEELKLLKELHGSPKGRTISLVLVWIGSSRPDT